MQETKFITTRQLADQIGRGLTTVQLACLRLGIPKAGRDYILTPQQAALVTRSIHPGPGRPRKH